MPALWAPNRLMGLFLDIVCPASDVLYGCERRGMPLDENRRATLVARTQARVDALAHRIGQAAAAFHATRRAKVQAGIDALLEKRAAMIETAPACVHHPTYRGLTKPGNRLCVSCIELYERNVGQRMRINEVNVRIVRGKALRARLGDEFDAAKPDHWRAWLFSVEGLGLRAVDLTPISGKPSIDDEAIEALQKKHPEIEVLAWRVEHSHLSNRLNGPLAVEADARGRVHYAYSLHRAWNGQVASGLDRSESDKTRRSAGNAQNITEVIRQMFAAEPGRVIVHVDYAQIETRIMAWLARCRGMMDVLMTPGGDIHSANAAAIYGCDPAKARTHRVRFGGSVVAARYAAKRATHGWDYGMGDVKTARLYGLTVGEARRARAAYFAAWPELALFQDELVKRVERDRSLTNPFGRKVRFYGFTYERGAWRTTEREEVIAFPVASTAKDIAKAVMRDLDAAARAEGAEMLTYTHDSFTFHALRGTEQALVARLTPILTRPWPQLGAWDGAFGEFRCPVDWSAGANWGEAHAPCDPDCPPECDRVNPDGLRKVVSGGEAA